METIEHLRHLFEYDDWANQRTIAAMDVNGSYRSRRILAHILITRQEYLERLGCKDSTGFDFWPVLDLEECKKLARTLREDYRLLLKDLNESDLDRKAKYKTSEGLPCENNYRELLTHVLLHSSIHRGNIVLKMRQEGFDPPKLDYILYLRDTRL